MFRVLVLLTILVGAVFCDEDIVTSNATEFADVSVTETVVASNVTEYANVSVNEAVVVSNITEDATVSVRKNIDASNVTDDANISVNKDITTSSVTEDAKVSVTKDIVASFVTEDANVSVNESVVPKQTYKEAEKEITDFINSLLRSLLPKIIGGSGEAKLTQKCTAGMMKIFGNVRRLKGWTLKMLDSMGKPSSGILTGTSYSMGNYDQCVDLSVTSKGKETTDPSEEMFRGMYCKVRIRFADVVIQTSKNYHKGIVNASDLGKLKEVIQTIPFIPVTSEYMNHFIGLCFPSTCTLDDVKQLIKVVEFPGTAMVDRCDIKAEVKVDHTQLVILCCFIFFGCLVVVSTFIDWILHIGKRTSDLKYEDKRCVSVTVSFSFCNNNKKLMKNILDDSEGILSGQSVRGVIVASVAWVVVGHTYLFPYDAFFTQASSLVNLRNYIAEEYFSYVVNFPLAIDALCVCYGFLLTFPLWYSSIKSQDVSVNMCSLIVQHYVKLCIPLLMCLGVIILLPLLGSGPFWEDLANMTAERCRNNAWAHVGMFSNFLDMDKQCLPHLWFVSCLAQLTAIGIILSWILSKSIKLGMFLIIAGIAACNVVVAIITYRNDLPPSYVAYFAEDMTSLFWKINQSLPLSHFGPYAIGMISGILVARGVHYRIRTCLSGFAWIACIALIYGLMHVLYIHRIDAFGSYWSAVFAGNQRTIFGICVAWVLIACSFDTGGFVNAIFSWRVFDPLYKLSYYAYLFHFVIITFTMGIGRTPFYYGHWELILKAGSFSMASYVLAYFLFMLLEMPLRSLKSACCTTKSRKIDVTPLNNVTNQKGSLLTPNTIQGTCKLWSISETTNGTSY